MRFYFHLHNDIETHDGEGVELADRAAAVRHAEDEARTMAAQSVGVGHLNLSHCIEVTDSAGTCLLKVTFGEVVEVKP
jgi:hypothetical protein